VRVDVVKQEVKTSEMKRDADQRPSAPILHPSIPRLRPARRPDTGLLAADSVGASVLIGAYHSQSDVTLANTDDGTASGTFDGLDQYVPFVFKFPEKVFSLLILSLSH
jgi:hypothetical protein